MHNTRKQNLEFKIAFSETNIHWLLGAEPVDQEAVKRMRSEIQRAEAEINQMGTELSRGKLPATEG